ncbi:MAG TPA: DUF3368 domain-containing protein [Chitinophagales bacterium]|nr:DUF3368 domain-containing protein [Chitinophagales bacterium]
MIVVSDTSPLRALWKIQHLHLLPALYESVLIPPAVVRELNSFKTSGADLSELVNAPWLEIGIIKNKNEVDLLLNDLDPGEAEAIVLARENNASLILMDEVAGRNKAEEYGLNVTGVLGVLLEAKKNRLIAEVKPIMDRLIAEARFFISAKLYSEILSAANELK